MLLHCLQCTLKVTQKHYGTHVAHLSHRLATTSNERESRRENLTDLSLQQYKGEQTACRCAADHDHEASSASAAVLSLAPPRGRGVVVDRAAQATPCDYINICVSVSRKDRQFQARDHISETTASTLHAFVLKSAKTVTVTHTKTSCDVHLRVGSRETLTISMSRGGNQNLHNSHREAASECTLMRSMRLRMGPQPTAHRNFMQVSQVTMLRQSAQKQLTTCTTRQH